MDTATLKRATEPFFTTKGVGKGTGLGLSMVDGFVSQSGGRMTISSQCGQGTTVELWLPMMDVTPVQEAVVAESPSSGITPICHILVVDDDPLVAAGTAAMLEDLGHSVVEVSSGAAALDRLDTNPNIELVITDYAMPVMSGIELARQINLKRPNLPIILATGYAELPSGEALSFPRLAKPYTQNHLAQAIASAIGSRRVNFPLPMAASA